MLPLSFCRIDEPHSPGYNEIQQKGSAALWIVSAVLTDEARQMLTAYDEYCEKLRAYGEKLFEETFAFYDDIPKQEVHKKEERYAR